MTILLAVLGGLAIGLLLGALGGGGSILTVPLLVYVLGQSPQDATIGALVIVGLSSLIALIPHVRAGNVRVVDGVIMGLLGAAGAVVGTRLSRLADPQVLLLAFAGLMLVVAALTLRRALRGGDGCQDGAHSILTRVDGRIRCDCPRLLKLAATALVVGVLTGLFGVGGGFLIVPALMLALGSTPAAAAGTSLLVIVLNSASALVSHGIHGLDLDWGLVAPVLLSAIAASLAAGAISSRLPRRVLQLAFAGLLAAVGLGMGISSGVALLG